MEPGERVDGPEIDGHPKPRPPARAEIIGYRDSYMAGKEEKIELEGEVMESFKSGMHRIALDNGHETLGYTSGRMRRYRIRINPGDRIKVELSPYDLTRGRIVYRER
jgi:translation initiation factor IF-1